MTLVRELRRRRFLGRLEVTRGKPPPPPKYQYFWKLSVFAKVILAVVFFWVAAYVFVFIGMLVQEALIIAGALALLWSMPAVRECILPLAKGQPFRGRFLVENSHPLATYSYGALPLGAAVFAPFHYDLMPFAIAAVTGGLAAKPLALYCNGKRLPANLFRAPVVTEDPVDTEQPGAFGLWLGESTGTLSALSHKTGIAPGCNVTLDLRDAAKGISVFGETGTGKTTRVLSNIMLSAMDTGAGGLLFDVRGDAYESIMQAATITKRSVQRIGIGHLGINLLSGLESDTAAGFLESVFKLLGQGDGDSAFWVQLATNRTKSALTILEQTPGGNGSE